MIFSKSFGYAIRSILYVSMQENENRKIQTQEISRRLDIPHHFLGKIMQKLAEEGILASTKGPYGGFSVVSKTLQTPLHEILMITEGNKMFETCTLRLKKCDPDNPCPLHHQVAQVREKILHMLRETTIASLHESGVDDFIKSITASN